MDQVLVVSWGKDGTPRKSDAIIEALRGMHPNMRKDGFHSAVQTMFPDDKDLAEIIGLIRPDAFAIHHDTKEIDLIEVVDTNPITKEKAVHIYRAAEHLLDLGWTLGVVTFDGAGNLTSHVAGVFYAPIYAQFDGQANNATPRAIRASKMDVSGVDLEAGMRAAWADPRWPDVNLKDGIDLSPSAHIVE